MFESVKNSLSLKQAIKKYKAILKQYIKRQFMRVGRKCTSRVHGYRRCLFKQKFYDWPFKKSVSCELWEDQVTTDIQSNPESGV